MNDHGPQRWEELPRGQDPVRDRGSDVLQAITKAQALSPAAFARVAARLRTARAPWFRRPAFRRAAVGTTVAFGLGLGVALANRGPGQAQRANPQPAASFSLPPAPGIAAHVPNATAVAPDAGRSVSRSAPAEVSERRRSAAAAQSDAEADLFQSALSALRQRSDPKEARRLLSAYQRRFPHGTFRSEALSAQVEASLSLGDEPSALETLDGFDRDGFRGVPRAPEMQLLRAELLTKANRAPAAEAALTALLGEDAPQAVTERALFDRGQSRLGRGERRAGLADLRAYLDRFPQGRFAPAARRATGEQP